jgi:Uma2 family endonuclease
MTLAHRPSLTDHAVLHGVSWDDYEKILSEIGNGPTRVTYFEGSIEIMPPLPLHERPSRAIGRLVEELTLEMGLPVATFGSTTFRRREEESGLEPDECFYIQNEAVVRDMTRFNPAKHPPPDLAIEVDITRRSIPREPIYARLKVAEIWRYDGQRLAIRLLSADGTYREVAKSVVFPFLPMDQLVKFVHRMLAEEQNAAFREFRKWVRKNRRKWGASKSSR